MGKKTYDFLSFYYILNHYNMHHRYSLNLIKTTTLETLHYFTDADGEATVIGDYIPWSLNHTIRISHTGARE